MASLTGRIIKAGKIAGELLYSSQPISFFGTVDPLTGIINEPGHPLQGKSVAGKILVFPHAKGSTVGSYILYALQKNHRAPAAMILAECEIIIAVGAIIAEIPTIDRVPIAELSTAKTCAIDGGTITVD